jgi:DNA repair protein RadC
VREWAASLFRPGAPVLDRCERIEAFLLAKLAGREYEVFAVILLDTQQRFIDYIEISQGDTNSVIVYSREVVKLAVRNNAAGVVLAHNHPSGQVTPSAGDVAVTRRLRDALALVDVRMIDHFIVGKTVTSFGKRGLLAA